MKCNSSLEYHSELLSMGCFKKLLDMEIKDQYFWLKKFEIFAYEGVFNKFMKIYIMKIMIYGFPNVCTRINSSFNSILCGFFEILSYMIKETCPLH